MRILIAVLFLFLVLAAPTSGEDVSQQLQADVPACKKAALAGDRAAAYILGTLYASGIAVKADPAEAKRWLILAADAGHSRAKEELYELRKLELDYSPPWVLCKEAPTLEEQAAACAKADDAGSQFRLGALYARGHGVPQSFSEAARLYRLAAEQGHVDAMFRLGGLYDAGAGVPKDLSESTRWRRRAAETGDPMAQMMLGVMYLQGEGMPKNYSEGVRWLRKAAAQGNEAARELLEDL